MADITQDLESLLGTAYELFRNSDCARECEILADARAEIEQTGYDNWNGGTDIYRVVLEIPLDVYAKWESELKSIEVSLKQRVEALFRKYPDVWLGEVVILPQLATPLRRRDLPSYTMSNKDLVADLEAQKNLMIAVSTDGPRIQKVDHEYSARQKRIGVGLTERGLEDPNPYADLWAWYGKWSSGDLPSYQSRRVYIGGLLNPLILQLRNEASSSDLLASVRPTGWPRVDRNIGEVRSTLGRARTEEQYQAVGLLCRETMISLAQAVYDAQNHPSPDGVEVSDTDAKRMLDAFLAAELGGQENEDVRRYAKAALSLANALTHKRTAGFRDAALCAEATTAVVNIVAIVSGQRDPEQLGPRIV